MRYKYFLLVLTLLGSAGCKKDKMATTTITPVVFSFTGTWKWVLSQGGIAGTKSTPASTGHTLQYTFHADSTMIITTDTSTTNSTYSTGTVSNVGSKVYLITIGNGEPKSYTYYRDTLVLADYGIADGYAYFFVKE